MELPAEPATFARAGKRGGLFFMLLLWVSLSTAALQGVTAERSSLRLGAANQALALAAPAPVSFSDGPAAGGGGDEQGDADEDDAQDEEMDDQQEEEQTESSETAGASSLDADSDDLIESGDAVAFDQASAKAAGERASPSGVTNPSASSEEAPAKRPSKEYLDRIGARAPVDENVRKSYDNMLEELQKDERYLKAREENDKDAEKRAQRINQWMARTPAPPRSSSPLPEKDPEAKRRYDEVVKELKEKFAKNAGTSTNNVVPGVPKGRPRK